MLASSRTRILFVAGLSAFAIAGLLSACTDDAPASEPVDAGTDARAVRDGAGSSDDDDDDDDAPTRDGGAEGGSTENEDGPGVEGEECSVNRDCKLALRCECEEGDCSCRPGTRGTGKNGVDTCASGNDCTSSICATGPSGSFCSDECETEADCTGNLPICFPIIGLPKPICWFPR